MVLVKQILRDKQLLVREEFKIYKNNLVIDLILNM